MQMFLSLAKLYMLHVKNKLFVIIFLNTNEDLK